MERVIVGTAEMIEAEFGIIPLWAGAFVAAVLYNNEPVSVEAFDNIEAAKQSVANDTIEIEIFI